MWRIVVNCQSHGPFYSVLHKGLYWDHYCSMYILLNSIESLLLINSICINMLMTAIFTSPYYQLSLQLQPTNSLTVYNIDDVYQWMGTRRLRLSPSKTHVMYIAWDGTAIW